MTADGAVGKCLALCYGALVFEIEEVVGFCWGVKGLGVPSWDCANLISFCGVSIIALMTIPILERRPNSSALRLKKPPWAASLLVGIIFDGG